MARDVALEVAPEAAGTRLDLFLARGLGLSRSQARRLLARGAVRVDGRDPGAGGKGVALAAGSQVEVRAFQEPGGVGPQPAPELPIETLARGPGWWVVDKPAGRPVHPLSEDEIATVTNAAVARHPEMIGVGEGGLRSGVVHRLDVDTSGALLLATGQEAWGRLRRAFAEHRVRKVYRALARGDVEGGTHRVGLRVAQHRPALVRVVEPGRAGSDGDVREGVLHLRPLEQLRGATLVEVDLETGFLHQIRATLAHLGHPVLGDRRYGDPDSGADPVPAKRQLLHAARLSVDEIDAASPDPPDLVAALTALRAPGD